MFPMSGASFTSECSIVIQIQKEFCLHKNSIFSYKFKWTSRYIKFTYESALLSWPMHLHFSNLMGRNRLIEISKEFNYKREIAIEMVPQSMESLCVTNTRNTSGDIFSTYTGIPSSYTYDFNQIIYNTPKLEMPFMSLWWPFFTLLIAAIIGAQTKLKWPSIWYCNDNGDNEEYDDDECDEYGQVLDMNIISTLQI